MTEEEWMACADPQVLLRYIRGKANQRRFALFVLDCARRNWELLHAAAHELYETIEGFVEGSRSRKALNAVYRKYTEGDMRVVPRWDDLAEWDSRTYMQLAMDRGTERIAQLVTLHDIFTNVVRPVAFDPAWRTTDVMLLAQGIYDEKAFPAMPILADALQDAGCDDEVLLGHLRDAGATHVRGCWALDLVLGKE